MTDVGSGQAIRPPLTDPPGLMCRVVLIVDAEGGHRKKHQVMIAPDVSLPTQRAPIKVIGHDE